MLIETISFDNYRSIEHAKLEHCGNLNILIGRNNTGKSNILRGINQFFRLINPETAVSLLDQDTAKNEINKQSADTVGPAHVIVSLLIDQSERTLLYDHIVGETPQMQNALEGISSDTRLEVSMTITSDPAMSYVDKIVLKSAGSQQNKTLLEISASAAAELRHRLSTTEQLEKEVQALERMTEDINFVGPDIEGPRAIRRGLPLNRMEPDLRHLKNEVSELTERVTDVSTFRQELNAIISQRQETIEAHHNALLSNPIQTFSGQEYSLPGYVKSLLRSVAEYKILYLDESRKPVGPHEASRLLNLKMRRGGAPELQAIQRTVTDLLGVHIDAFQADTPVPNTQRRSRNANTAEMDVDSFLVQLNGSGIREALRLVLDVNFEQPQTLLLEEPEVHLHPALEYSVLQYLKEQSANQQIFLTTHSTNFLDSPEASNVYLVDKSHSSTVKTLQIDDFEDELPKELGIRLSSVFMFDRLVFVEGPSDESVLREIAARVGINFSKAGVGFVQMGGARSFSHYASANLMTVLSKRQVKLAFVIDQDERTADEIQRMAAQCGGIADLHVLGRRELENFLLNPEAISLLIEQKSQGKTSVTADEVSEQIHHSAESLRFTSTARQAFQKISSPLRISRENISATDTEGLVAEVKNQIDELRQQLHDLDTGLHDLVEESATDINSRWEANKLSLAPGADILDTVMKTYGLRYRKERDGATLARLIPQQEIPAELRELLHNLI